MSSDELAVRVENLSKCYQIYERPQDRLKQSLIPRLRRLLGKSAPNYYREFWALRDISFEVRKGETVGIIGRNGSGKSTLLQIICGTLTPTTGTVDTAGRAAALLELGAGFNPEFTGRENVYLNGSVLGLRREEIDKRFDAIAAFADIGEFIKQPVKTYSSGMYVRLAFAIAVHTDPNILIIDEALSVGDIRFQNKCLRKLNECRDIGQSILFVSHSPTVVEAFCDRVVWIMDGNVCASGHPAKLVREFVNYMIHGTEPITTHISQPARFGKDLWPYEPEQEGIWQWHPIGTKNNVRQTGGALIRRVRVRVNGQPNVNNVEPAPFILDIEAEIEFREPVAQPLIAIGIMNDLNEPIVHFNSYSIHQGPMSVGANIVSEMRASASLPAFRPGDYLLALGVDDGVPGSSNLLCHVYDAWVFRVGLPADGRAQSGYVQAQDATIVLGAHIEGAR